MLAVEPRDRLARVSAESVEAALSAQGRRLGLVEAGEVNDDVVRDMSGLRARRCGRRSAKKRAETALRCGAHDVGPMVVSEGAGRLSL